MTDEPIALWVLVRRYRRALLITYAMLAVNLVMTVVAGVMGWPFAAMIWGAGVAWQFVMVQRNTRNYRAIRTIERHTQDVLDMMAREDT